MKPSWLVFVVAGIIVAPVPVYEWYTSPPPGVHSGEDISNSLAWDAYNHFHRLGWLVHENVSLSWSLNHAYYIYLSGHGDSYRAKWNDSYITVRDLPEFKGLPINFVMIVSCGAGDYTGPWTWAGAIPARVMVLYRYNDDSSWRVFGRWQTSFFNNLRYGCTFRDAIDRATDAWHDMDGHILLVGDGNATAVSLTIPRADVNMDRRVNVLDMIIISQYWTG
jgi:hypothetical protein